MKNFALLLTFLCTLAVAPLVYGYTARPWDEDTSASWNGSYTVLVGAASGTTSSDHAHGSGITVIKYDGTYLIGSSTAGASAETNLICKSGNPTTNLPPACHAGNYTGDYRIRYDWENGRWLFTALDLFPSTPSLIIAASETGDPTGKWYVYETTRDDITDSPMIGTCKYWMMVNGNRETNTDLFDLATIEAGNNLVFGGGSPTAWGLSGNAGFGAAFEASTGTVSDNCYAFSYAGPDTSTPTHPQIQIDKYSGTEFLPTATLNWKTLDFTSVNIDSTGGQDTSFPVSGSHTLTVDGIVPSGQLTLDSAGTDLIFITSLQLLNTNSTPISEGYYFWYDITSGTKYAQAYNFGSSSNQIVNTETGPLITTSTNDVMIGAEYTTASIYPSWAYAKWTPSTSTITAGGSIAGSALPDDCTTHGDIPLGRWADFNPNCGDAALVQGSLRNPDVSMCGQVAVPGPPDNYWGSLCGDSDSDEINFVVGVN